MWWQFTPTEAQTYVASFDENENNSISVWSGTDFPLTELACNRDIVLSKVWWEGEIGVTYWIRVAGTNDSDEDEFVVRLAIPPVGDDLSGSSIVTDLPFIETVSNIDATLEAEEVLASCGGGNNSMWWQFTPLESGTYVATFENNAYEAISVWSGSEHPLTEVACDFESGRPKTWWEGEAGTPYWIRITGWNDFDQGDITIRVAPAPIGDDIAEAFEVTNTPFADSKTLRDGTLEENELIGDCNARDNSIWWRFTPTITQTYTATFSDRNSGHISIWTGSAHPLEEIVCITNTFPPLVEWIGESGTPYWIRVASRSISDEAPINLSITGEINEVRPVNDALASAIPVTFPLPFEDMQTSLNGTSETNELSPSCGTGDNSIWWQLTAPESTIYQVTTEGTATPSVISLWQGTTHPLSELNCTQTDRLFWNAEVGAVYYIQVANQTDGANGGDVRITLQQSEIMLGEPLLVDEPQNNVNIPLEVTFVAPFTPSESLLFFRRTSDSSYVSTQLVSQGGNLYAGTIPADYVTEEGVDYYVFFSDGQNTYTFPMANPTETPLRATVRLLERTFPLTRTPNTYSMVSFPIDLDDPAFDVMLEDDYGPFNGEDWGIYRWESAEGAHNQYPDLPSTARGEAYWLITNSDTAFDIEAGTSPDVTTPTTITLEPGWNQISTPFPFPIAWDQGNLPSNVSLLAEWVNELTGYAYDINILEPWKGYFAFNNGTAPVDISVSPIPARVTAAKNERKWFDRGGYLIQAIATQAERQLTDTENYFGFSLRDSSAYLVREAPGIGSQVRLSLIQDGQRLAGDFRPYTQEGQWWDIEVDLKEENGLFTTRDRIDIQLLESGQRPEDLTLYVLDQDLGKPVALRENRFSLETNGSLSSRRLRIILGTEAFAEANSEGSSLEPLEAALEPNYPNPFTGDTQIGYQVAETQHVRIDVYNVLGQRIAVLVDETKEAGVYATTWNGRDATGQPAPSGLYLYRMQTGATTLNRTMILRR